MSNLSVKGIFEREDVKNKLRDMLGSKSTGFISSVLQVTTNNNLLAKADPLTVYNAAMMAAALDLPINQNLGFAWIVPYKGQAQFQMGAKGYVQLAQRTGQYQRINVTAVYENQYKGWNSLTEELDADFNVFGSGKVVGYAAYFELNNGFKKTVYWSREQVESHAKRFSQSFNQSFSPWKSDFDAMAQKTVLKHTLSKWGILSIEMQTAHKVDQSVIKDYETEDIEYVDNGTAQSELPEFTELHFEDAFNNGATIELIRKGYSVSEEIEQDYIDYCNAKKS
jgi:recombination protein RecT